jgi:multidrug efflux pump subunit AcrA (membrane-fusion protein)
MMMRLLRSRWGIVAAAALVVGLVAVFMATRRAGADEAGLVAKVTRGDFKVLVTIAGDLRAKSSVQIAPPQNTCMVGACQMKISTIIPEGTRVKQGDTVAELDRSPIVTYTTSTNLALQKAQAVFEQAQLDTTLNLSKAREDLRLSTTALEEKRIGKDESKYEAPSSGRRRLTTTRPSGRSSRAKRITSRAKTRPRRKCAR